MLIKIYLTFIATCRSLEMIRRMKLKDLRSLHSKLKTILKWQSTISYKCWS